MKKLSKMGSSKFEFDGVEGVGLHPFKVNVK